MKFTKQGEIRSGTVAVRSRDAVCVAANSPGVAGARPVRISAKPVGSALQDLAKQSGTQIIFFSDSTEGYAAPALRGRLTLQDALASLLEGTDLTFRQINRNTVYVQARDGFRRTAATLPVMAQAVPVAAAEAPASAGTLEEVIVTARKVRESQQDTPVAITAFSGEALEERQIFATDRLTQVVPNLQFGTNAPLAGNNASSQVFVRGVGQTDPTSTVDPGVGLYIDDVYMGSAVGARMDLRDIASVQVLRGPQGTLFGRNTIGGAILLSTTEPGNEFGMTLRGGLGSDGLFDGFIGMDLPMGETVRTRFTAGRRKQDGYVTRTDGTDLGDTNTWTVTGKLIWNPNDRTELRLLADYSKADENGSPLVFAAINRSATFPRVASADAGCPGFNGSFATLPAVPNIADNRCANDFQNRGPFRNNGTAPLVSKLDGYGSSLQPQYEASDAWTLKAITGYRNVDWLGNRDADNTPLTILNTIYDVTSWQFSQELQGVYQRNALTGVVGAFYFKQRSRDIATVELNPPPPGVQRDSDNNSVDNRSWAAFTQWTYKFNDAFSGTAGVRYTEDKKGAYPDQFDYSAPAVKQVPVQWYRKTFSDTTMSGSLNYRINREAMVYASYSEGFKGGGWNSHFNSVLSSAQQAALHQFKPETVNSYEIGGKFDLLGNTMRLNVAAFNSDYTDMQITYRGPAPNGVAPFLTNAGKASIKGAEVEFTWQPTTDLRFEASAGRLKSRIDRLDISSVAVIPPGLAVGNELPFAPRWQTHLGAAYTLHTGNIDITPRIDASYQGRTYFDAVNTPQIAQLGGYTVFNGSISLQPADGDWRVNLGVNNAGNKLYRIAGNSSLGTGSGYAEVAYARPREYFGSVSYSFHGGR